MRLRALSIAVAAMVAPASAVQAQQLPDGAGKETVVKLCSTCHPPERGASVRLTREGWQDVMTRMVALGMRGTDDELNAALEYLATHFKGEAVAPLNVNRATPVQLQSIAGLLRSESAALIAHRTKAGPCKNLEDLKGVPGLDYGKIEQRRDRLVCF